MPKCKNDPKKSFKGNESSPKGLGFCAHVENIGITKKGKDGNKWKIETTSKGVKRWVKQTSKTTSKLMKDMFSELNKSQEHTIYLLKNDIKNELKKIGVKLLFKNLKKINEYYILDYVWPEKYNDKDKFIIVVFKLDSNNKLYIPNKELNCQHNNITHNTKKESITIFKNYLKNKFKWNGKQTHTINIEL
tara:strand:+ start:3551 stop:4120 length:570 start_codon:yes stop_codon:yes gene_type:complete